MRIHVLPIVIVLAILPSSGLAQEKTPDLSEPKKFEIVDNSFFVEEAFNQDRGVFQNLVGGHAGQLVKREPPFVVARSPLLHDQIGLPILGLGRHLRLENAREGRIGPIFGCGTIVGLPYAREVLCGGIVGTDAVDPGRLRLTECTSDEKR